MKWVDMNLKAFKLMTQTRQLDMLYRHGVYIGKSRKDDCITILMQLGSFYAEIYYLQYRSLVREIEVFSSPVGIDEYLQPIEIDIENLAR